MFFFWRKKYKGQLIERAVARTGELRHGAPAALPVAEDEADELLVLFRRPRALLQPHLLAARLPPHFFFDQELLFDQEQRSNGGGTSSLLGRSSTDPPPAFIREQRGEHGQSSS
jgi:hypothetical protein